MRKYINIVIVFVVLALSCSTVSKKIIYENNFFKNLAAENSQNANEFIKKVDYRKALIYLNDSLKYNIMADNIPGIIQNYCSLGRVNLLLNNFDEGIELYKTALEIVENEKESIDNKKEEAFVLNGLGEAYHLVKRFDEARGYFSRAKKIESNLGNMENIALINQNMGKIEKAEGNLEKALEYYTSSSSILEDLYKKKKIENIKNLSLIYYSIGHLYSKLNNPSKAIGYIKMALDIDKMTEEVNGIADDYFALGILYLKSEMIKKSLISFMKSRDIYKILDNIQQYEAVNDYLIEIFFSQSELKKYFNILEEQYVIKKDNKDKSIIKNKITELIQFENIGDFFSSEEIKTIIEKYKK